MLPINDFSGLESSVWAFAKAVAIAATLSLDRCTARLLLQEVEAHSARFGSLCPDTMAHCLFGILRHQSLELGLCPLVLQVRGPRFPEQGCILCPRIGGVHVNDPDGRNPRL